jgi:hypothetical protein
MPDFFLQSSRLGFRLCQESDFLLATGEHVGCCGLHPQGAQPGSPYTHDEFYEPTGQTLTTRLTFSPKAKAPLLETEQDMLNGC